MYFSSLQQVKNLLEEASDKEIEGELDIVKALKEEFLVKKTQLVYSISEVRQKVNMTSLDTDIQLKELDSKL